MSLGQQEGASVEARTTLARERLARDDEARRIALCLACGIDPNRKRVPRPLSKPSQGPQQPGHRRNHNLSR